MAFKFNILTGSNAQDKYNAITIKDNDTFYLLETGIGYFKGKKCFDANISTTSLINEIEPGDNIPTEKAIVDYITQVLENKVEYEFDGTISSDDSNNNTSNSNNIASYFDSNGVLLTEHGGTGNNAGHVTVGMDIGSKEQYNPENYNTIEGNINIISDTSYCCHVEGECSQASCDCSHAEGYSACAIANYSHAQNYACEAGGEHSHAGGISSTAIGNASFVHGSYVTANTDESVCFGNYTIANAIRQFVIGICNVVSSQVADRFIIGNGTKPNERSNCFRINDTGVYASGSYNASGADYAEYFEWEDGNPDNEDRVGRFVTLDGDKIKLASSTDKYILGIVSANPSCIGDSQDDQWARMYLYDIYGRPLWEDVEVPDIYDEKEIIDKKTGEKIIKKVLITKAHHERKIKINPDYDSSKPYLKRSERSEWDVVGLLGKLVVLDDGTCKPNSYCKPSNNGIATATTTRTQYRVMNRLDDNHIKVLIL